MMANEVSLRTSQEAMADVKLGQTPPQRQQDAAQLGWFDWLHVSVNEMTV